MQLNDTGEQVRLLQIRLTTKGYPLKADGEFGPKTDSAVRAFQADHKLIIDGVAGDKTLGVLYGKDAKRFLSDADIEAAAQQLGIDVGCIYALKTVESRGNGYLPDGRVAILYERHIMRRRLLANGFKRDQVRQLCTRYPALISSKPGGYRGAAAEHFRLRTAQQIDSSSALEACSWGLFLIMGFHWQRLGYLNIEEFVTLQRESESQQLDTFVRFIEADPVLHQALKAHDWQTFARIYNGSGYRKNQYDTKLANAYAHYMPEAA